MALKLPWPYFAEPRILYDLTRDSVNRGRGNVLFQGYFDQASE
jgi:hypothetical protein